MISLQAIVELGGKMRTLLKNEQWERIKHMLPGKAGDPGRRAEDNRNFVEAVLWIARTGSPWRDLPPAFGPWNSVYVRFARWSRSGVWQRVFMELSKDSEFAQRVYLDSTIVRAHQHAAGAVKKTARKLWAARAAD
jgi:transposase